MDDLRLLNEQWKKKHYEKLGYTNYIYDGCSDYDKYEETPLKILYIAKEAYITEDDPRTLENPYIKDEDGKLTWYCTDQHKEQGTVVGYTRMTSLCTQILENAVGEGDFTINNIAMMDLKKSKDPNDPNEPKTGNPATGNIKRIKRFVEEDRDLIIREIELINPDLIICGGTYACMEDLFSDKTEVLFDSFGRKSLRKIVSTELVSGDKIIPVTILDMYHFGARIGRFDEVSKEIASAYNSIKNR